MQDIEFNSVRGSTLQIFARDLITVPVAEPNMEEINLAGRDGTTYTFDGTYKATDARVIELEWDAVKNEIYSVTLGDYQFDYISNQMSLNNRIQSAIRSDGSVIGSQVQGILNAAKAQFHAMREVAQKQDIRAMLFEDLDPKSPTFGAMCLGTMGFEIASKRTANGTDWDWKTFGTGAGFLADFIVAGTMLADRIKGGTLELKVYR